ncbi:MAG: endonuclease [Chitinophagaceae bacterium]
MKKSFLLFITALFTLAGYSQIVLSGTNYTQDFDGVHSGMPEGFTVRRNASATSLGTIETPTLTTSGWSTSAGAYYNMASTDGLTSGASNATQATSTDRVIGLRQSSGFADGSAAFVMQLANTTGFNSFSLSFNLQSLDVAATRTSTWNVDYGFGSVPSTFTAITTSPVTLTTGGSTFLSTTVNVNFGSAFDNISQPVWIRIVNLTASTGSGTRPATGIDDVVLNYLNVSSCTPPSIQTSAASITGVTNNSMDISWTNGNGTNSLVVVKAGSAVVGTPASGTAYISNVNFGAGQTIAAGEYVVYNGNSNSVSLSGLSAGTTYYTSVYSFNATDNCYLITTPATASATTTGGGCTKPTTQAGTITINAATTSATINWVAGSGSNSLVKLNTVNNFTPPTDGGTYSASAVYAGSEQVIYNSTGTTTALTGLAENTTYYATVYTFNPCSGTPNYLVLSNTVQPFTTLQNSGIPVNYYNSAVGLNCAPLKTALMGITTTNHIQLNYSDLDNVQMPSSDDRLNDAGTQTIIWDIYSDNQMGPEPYEYTFGALFNGGTGNTEGTGWNKEHSFPNSWFSASSSTSNFPGADLHHIFPTDKTINSKRSNMPYGKVATTSQIFLNGSKIGTSALTFPGLTGNVFEPTDAYKGDLARVIFYMVTRYQINMPAWEALEAGGDVVMDGKTWPSMETEYLQMLLNWHNLDPVSQKEIDRNNSVYGFQQNRNPFVDHPEYVEMIWSSLCNVLPVDIISFSGFNHSGKISLEWEVANAERFSAFIVERSIDGGRTFSERAAINYLQNLNSYKFDENAGLLQGDIYYRIKLVDISGAYRYSKVIRVTVREDKELVILYPNPATDKITISFPNPVGQPYIITITDLSGRVLIKSSMLPGLRNTELNIGNLPVGTYLLNLRFAEKVIIKKIIRQ